MSHENKLRADLVIHARVSRFHLGTCIKGLQKTREITPKSYSDAGYWIFRHYAEIQEASGTIKPMSALENTEFLASLGMKPQQGSRITKADIQHAEMLGKELNLREAMIEAEQIAGTDDDPFKEYNEERKRKTQGR